MSEPVFVLHTRNFRESSLIAELLTPGHGRVGVVARGGRRGRRGGAGALQPFTLLQAEWTGRGELRTLTQAESERSFPLAGERLFAGLYLNELLLRLLHREEAQPDIFERYLHTLDALAADGDLEPVLRRFELHLLADLGYGFALDHDVHGQPIAAEARYRFLADEGLMPVGDGVRDATADGAGAPLFSGGHLLALAADALDDAEVRRSAKQLTRLALAAHLGGRPLRSRELFRRRRADPTQ
ncbi:MAG: DNA repair protein RecO [Gammaproteobacteria bacterium]|nr:DNA repair protein RecO [Gammaproteobacteria bacterium]